MSQAGRKFKTKKRGIGMKNGNPNVGSTSGGLESSNTLGPGTEHPLPYELAGRRPGFASACADVAANPPTVEATAAVEIARRRKKCLFMMVFLPCEGCVGRVACAPCGNLAVPSTSAIWWREYFSLVILDAVDTDVATRRVAS